MAYWLKSAGTAEAPLGANWYSGGRSWRERWGNAQMFSRRPKVKAGDRLVMYAVGSPGLFREGRIFAVMGVTAEPEPSAHDRWPWQVEAVMLIPGPRLTSCPTIVDIDVERTSLSQQSHITLSD